jgi:hypothetical protein
VWSHSGGLLHHIRRPPPLLSSARPSSPDLPRVVPRLPVLGPVAVLVVGKETGRNPGGDDARGHRFSSLEASSRYSLLPTPPLLVSRGENPNFVGRQRRHRRRDLLGGATLGTTGVRGFCCWCWRVGGGDVVHFDGAGGECAPSVSGVLSARRVRVLTGGTMPSSLGERGRVLLYWLQQRGVVREPKLLPLVPCLIPRCVLLALHLLCLLRHLKPAIFFSCVVGPVTISDGAISVCLLQQGSRVRSLS